MRFVAPIKVAARVALDFALPSRCPGCGTIVGPNPGFCANCWSELRFAQDPCCNSCGVPLDTELVADIRCGSCLAAPPPWESARAALVYDSIPAAIAMRLKYGRRIELARLMAGYMMQRAPAACRGDVEQWLVVPVPLHRWRLWHRGFNQSLLIARHVARGLDLHVDPFLLRRVKSTRPLRNMNPREREDTVRRAFAIDQRRKWQLKGKSIILIDDILTSGATARACSRILLREGAAAVHLLCWARVNDMVGGD